MAERGEALMRIVVFIVSGIILHVWKILIALFAIINFIWTIISGNRIKDLAELSEIWNTQHYRFVRYIVFQSNERPFPFTKLAKNISTYK